jgi:thioesterase domain-containing protein/acyl carrier protein
LKEKLPEPMLPTAFVLLDKLPLTSNGKINRRALPPPDAAHMAFEETYIAPRNAIEEALAELWANILGLERVGVRDNFFDLGGHSLLAVRLMAQIQRWFGRDIPLATLFQQGTIEHLATLLGQQVETLPQSPLVKIQSIGTKLPFFCVHPADGTVLSYVALARYLGEDQPFYGLQVAHLDEAQPPQTRLKAMAAEYLDAIRAVQPHGPYLLGGWSMGGIVAFEMAQQLQRQGQPVALLALLDSWTPDSDPRYPAGYHLPMVPQPTGEDLETQLLIDFLRHLRGRYAKELPPLPDDFHQLGPHEKLPYILEHAQILELVFPEGGLSQLHRLLQVFKANVQAMSSYIPQIYRGRIVLFQATEWFAAAQHPQGHMPDSAVGWQRLSTEPLEVRSVPGDNYTMLAEPNIQILAEQLKICLNEAQLMRAVTSEW